MFFIAFLVPNAIFNTPFSTNTKLSKSFPNSQNIHFDVHFTIQYRIHSIKYKIRYTTLKATPFTLKLSRLWSIILLISEQVSLLHDVTCLLGHTSISTAKQQNICVNVETWIKTSKTWMYPRTIYDLLTDLLTGWLVGWLTFNDKEFAALMELYFLAKNEKKLAKVIVAILKICYFSKLWAWLGMPCHAMPIQNMAIHMQLSWNFNYMQNIKAKAQTNAKILTTFISANFNLALAYLYTPTQNVAINLQFLWNFIYIKKIKAKAQTNAKIFKILIFQHTLGMPRHAWPRPLKIWKLICSSQGTLLACTKSKQ